MKMKRIFSCILALVVVFSCAAMAGCETTITKYEVPNYQGQLKEGQTKSDFNKELFYRNDRKIPESPDPFVFDNTAVDG